MSGTLPSELGNLSSLTTLDLDRNSFTGTIPLQVLSSLSSLRTLDLSYNQFSGTLPVTIEQNMASLQYLYLQNNALTGPIPVAELGGLSSTLSHLYLERNLLTGTIEFGGPLCELRFISLSVLRTDCAAVNDNIEVQCDCCTSCITSALPPDATSAWPTMAATSSPVVPPTVSSAPSMVPPDVALQRSALEAFYAATGGQSWVSNTNWLVDPNICTWAGIGCDTTQQFVITLRLQSNRLSGSLPVELAQLSKLTDLRLDTNTITGTLPSELGALTSLHTLFLQSNSLTGALPSELGQLTSLRYLYLHQNALTGALPNELVSLKSMRTLYLSYNSFNGVVPVDMLASMSASLNTLHLQRNELTGAIASGSALCEARLIRGLSTLRVDCLGATPEIECDCCTTCYESRDPAVRNGQKAVLEGIYEATNGPSWTYNTQWLVAGTNECDWYGVSCDAEGYITTLSLNNNNLDGTLSADIGLLSYIKYLRMYNNANLSGTIPSEIGTLKSLYSWDMYSNALSGSIPSEIFGVGNTALYSINLNSNDLRGTIPSEIANLSDTLRNLYLNYNSLTGTIPVDALGSMKLLNNLYLQRNEVVGNVTYTDNLCQLRTNQLSQLRTDCNGAEPEVVCECCTACYESRDPGALMSQKSILEELYEATNGTLWRIKTNWLVTGTSECSWYGISCEAEGYVSRLYFYDNFLAGSIPSSIGQLPYLDQLYMPRNTLSGSIPSEIGMLQSLRYFDVQYNSLSGSIPSEIGKLTQLYYLELDHNALTGTLPSEMSKLASLTYIHLQFNMLTGTVPVEALGYENLPNLDRLYLYRNLLTGSISTSDALCQSRYTASGIGSLSDLYVDCAGAMPEIECDCCTSCHQSRNVAILSTQRSALEEFYAATNGPSWRYNTNWLVEGTNECDWYGVNCDSEGYVDDINLDYNSLAGSVPTSIGTLVYLNTIYLDDNLIGGTLPSEIGQLTSLETLHISSNALIGSIPSEIGELTGLESLRLDDNALTGTIPTEVGRLSLLGYVILNNNSLSGTIPLAEFGSLSSLYSLYLGSNELTTDNNSGISLNDPLCVSRLKNVLDTLVVDCGAPDGQPQLAEVPCSCCTDCYESRDPAQRTIQKSALEAFYASTNGILWAINGNWMVDPDVCTWSGVSCDDEGYVTSLSFSYNGGNSLNGILPSDIGSLPYLQMLRLGSNPLLGGTIPSEIGQLKSLGYLKLDYNALSGTMPSEIGALTSLYYLDLEFNNLRGTIPATFGSLKELSRAYLNDNSFSGPIPTSEFANLKKLGVLELHGNDFSGTITNDSPLCILRYDDLDDLTMNCGGGSAGEVSCECCTECYSDQPVSPTPPTPPSPPTPLIPPPTRSPTASPTFTPAITTSVTSPSTFESNYDNITQFIDYLADFDADFKDHLEATANALIAAYDNEYYSSYDSSSGDDYSYDYYRAGARPKKKHRVQNYKLSRSLDHNHGHRVLQNSYSLLVIAEVTSEIVGTGSDGDCNPSDPSYNCYMVETEIDVKHNPVLYPEDAVSLVVVAESSEFIADYGTYAGSVPVQLDSQVELQVTGVTDRDMSPDEIQVFEDAVLNFLQDSLISGSTSSPPIFVQNSTLVQQTISSLPSSSGGGSDGGDDNNGSDGGSSGSSSSSVLTAVVNVNGEYLPPPEIEFEDVVVEAFNDEGEEFTETLQESNDPYFSEVSAVSAKSISTDDDSSGGDEDAFGPLGMAGGVSIIIIALVGAFMGAFFVYWKKRGKANLMRKTMMHRTSMGDVPMQVEEEEVVEEEEPDVHVLVEEAPLPPKPVVTGARSLVSTTVEEFVQTSQGVERTSIKTTTNEEAS
uniref:Leucine-rich repeat-containing N-terminal plant-type domain-containing protein n=1 Tax=Leptocylindrus danicus TaxID=163516 RepID=A0A7S2NR12_9STRA